MTPHFRHFHTFILCCFGFIFLTSDPHGIFIFFSLNRCFADGRPTSGSLCISHLFELLLETVFLRTNENGELFLFFSLPPSSLPPSLVPPSLPSPPPPLPNPKMCTAQLSRLCLRSQRTHYSM